MAVELYDEHEQGERVRKWIKEYSATIVMGLILAFAGIFGFRYWQDYRAGQLALGSEYYQVIQNLAEQGDAEAVAAEYESMTAAVGHSAYAGLAGLHVAAAWVDDGRLGKAESIYREILDNRKLKALWPVVNLRLARVLEAQGEHEEALALLDGASPKGYEAAWLEARGDVLFERGRTDDARVAWEEALARRSADGQNVGLLEIKLDAAASGKGSS
ncbi:MAG TPA: tetratricopeptide repeat protein [Wenzhouxiangella sp.]|nr:tetratricopeptide repeat protein [Wenzhouxiangella sp.]